MTIHDPKKAKAEKDAAKAKAEKGVTVALMVDGKRYVVQQSEVAPSHDRELWLQSNGLTFRTVVGALAAAAADGLLPAPFIVAAVMFLAERQIGNRRATLADFEAVMGYDALTDGRVDYADPEDDSPEA